MAEAARPGWFRRLLATVRAQLTQGLAPRPAALALSLGLWLGLVPLLGVSTLACVLAALALRLNQALMQAVNYLAYPLQLLLILPFYAAGTRVFGGPGLSLSLDQLMERARTAPWALLGEIGLLAWHGVAVWAAAGLLFVPLSWAFLTFVLKRWTRARA